MIPDAREKEASVEAREEGSAADSEDGEERKACNEHSECEARHDGEDGGADREAGALALLAS